MVVGGPRILEDFEILKEGDEDELVLVLESQDSVSVLERQGILKGIFSREFIFLGFTLSFKKHYSKHFTTSYVCNEQIFVILLLIPGKIFFNFIFTKCTDNIILHPLMLFEYKVTNC